MHNVEEKNQDKAKALLAEGFGKQDDRTFNKEYIAAFITRMLDLIRLESIDLVPSKKWWLDTSKKFEVSNHHYSLSKQ